MTIAVCLGILALLGIGVGLRDWRAGILMCVPIGFLADPLRKVIPGEPVVLVVAVGIAFGGAFLGFFDRCGSRLPLDHMPLWRVLKKPLRLFLVWLVVQSVHSLLRYRNPVLTGIGVMSYMAPLLALLLAYFFGRQLSSVRRFLMLYLTFACAMQVGSYLSFFGADWRILQQVGEALYITTMGSTIAAYTGFFRAPEVAAWHGAMAICLLVVLSTCGWLRVPRQFVGLAIAFIAAAGVLTGRRKMFVVIVVFLAFYVYFLIRDRRGAAHSLGVSLLVGGIVAGFAIQLFVPAEVSNTFNPYVQRTSTVFAEAPERMSMLGLGTIRWAIAGFGPLGGGAGIASQGTQHFGAGWEGAGEGGLGKVTAELGVPGLVLVLWCFYRLVRYGHWLTRRATRQPAETSALSLGLTSIIAAQIPSFIVASQIYGDLFVLVLLGLLLGFALAVPDAVAAHMATVQRPAPAAREPGVRTRRPLPRGV